jgi:hypothetical protein
MLPGHRQYQQELPASNHHILLLCLRNWYPGQVNVLHYSPDNGQTTSFGRKGVHLIGSLPHIEEAEKK